MRLLLADLDGTLVESWRDTILPGIPERLAEWRDRGAWVAVATNQGGVGYRYAHEQRGEWAQAARYLTLDQTLTRLVTIADALLIDRIYPACTTAGKTGRYRLNGRTDAPSSTGA